MMRPLALAEWPQPIRHPRPPDEDVPGGEQPDPSALPFVDWVMPPVPYASLPPAQVPGVVPPASGADPVPEDSSMPRTSLPPSGAGLSVAPNIPTGALAIALAEQEARQGQTDGHVARGDQAGRTPPPEAGQGSMQEGLPDGIAEAGETGISPLAPMPVALKPVEMAVDPEAVEAMRAPATGGTVVTIPPADLMAPLGRVRSVEAAAPVIGAPGVGRLKASNSSGVQAADVAASGPGATLAGDTGVAAPAELMVPEADPVPIQPKQTEAAYHLPARGHLPGQGLEELVDDGAAGGPDRLAQMPQVETVDDERPGADAGEYDAEDRSVQLLHAAKSGPDPLSEALAAASAGLSPSQDAFASFDGASLDGPSGGMTGTSSPPGRHDALFAALREAGLGIAQALKTQPDGTLEVVLRPEELGQVRLLLRPDDGGMSIALHAERPETLELMRRHIDLLLNDFRELGYGALSLRFAGEEAGYFRGGGASAPAPASAPDPADRPEGADSAVGATSRAAPLLPPGSLDLRI